MTLGQMIIDALKRLAGSMKAWTMVLGLLTAIGAKYGFNVDPTTFWIIVGAFATLLGAQGATDWGKSSAKLYTANSVPAVSVQAQEISRSRLLMSDGTEIDIKDALERAGYTKTQTIMPVVGSKPGFAALWVLAAITLIGTAVIAVTLSCTAAQKADVTTVKNGAIACGKTEFLKQLLPVATLLLDHPSDTETKLDAIGVQSGEDVLACALKATLTVLSAPQSAPVTAMARTTPSQGVVIGQNYIAKHNYHFVGE